MKPYFVKIYNKERDKKMDLKKYNCPVCNNQFNENDDVVVCPECGTPHHRECYKNNGGCFNENAHGTNESVEFTFKNTTPNEEISDNVNNDVEKNLNDNETVKKILEEIPDIIKMSPAQNALIEGKHAYLYELAIGKNKEYYIPRFMLMNNLKKGISWNFFAFLTPLAWTLYRKMYKFSAVILAIYILIFGLTGFYIVSNEEFMDLNAACMQEDPNYMSNIMIYNSGSGDVTLTVKQQELMEVMNNLTVPLYVSIASSVLPFVLRFYLGLFANKKYMQKIKKNIEKAEQKGLQGDNLKKYLYKKYGTLPLILVGIIGFFELFSIYY